MLDFVPMNIYDRFNSLNQFKEDILSGLVYSEVRSNILQSISLDATAQFYVYVILGKSEMAEVYYDPNSNSYYMIMGEYK